MVDGSLLYCPNCATTPRPNGRIFPQVLGAILSNGDIKIIRNHAGTTILHASEHIVSCACGFTYHLQGTAVMGTYMYQMV